MTQENIFIYLSYLERVESGCQRGFWESSKPCALILPMKMFKYCYLILVCTFNLSFRKKVLNNEIEYIFIMMEITFWKISAKQKQTVMCFTKVKKQ